MNLWPLDPTKTIIKRKDGRKTYLYKDGSRDITYMSSEIIDVPFMLDVDGVSHVDPITKLKGAVGLAIALEQYAQKFFANGGVPPLALYGPMPSPGAAARAAADVTQAVKDANAERRNVMIMPSGHELKPVGVDPQKSQMEEARRFQIEEIARVFDIPPVFLQDLTHGTFSNTEQQDLHFVKHTLRQWLKAWEDEMNLKLFAPRNRTKFVEFNLDALLRGDFKTRMDGWRSAVQGSIVTPDEVRDSENWPKYTGEGGDKLWMQGATMPIDILVKGPRPAPAPANDNTKKDAAA
jgi:HK97 family phage portal protein